MPRLLYAGVNREYLNRSRLVLLHAMRAGHEMDFFGPGYTPPEELGCGLAKWIECHGPYDIILFDNYTLFFEDIISRKAPFIVDVLHFDPKYFPAFAKDARDYLKSGSEATVFIASIDFYAVSEASIEQLAEVDCHILDNSLSQMTVDEKQEHNQRLGLPVRTAIAANNNWLEMTQARPEKIISLPHTVSTTQTSFTPLATRTEPLVVPGVSYAERKELYKHLTIIQQVKLLARKVNDRLHFMRHTSLSEPRLRTMHDRYDAEIKRAKASYVSGSAHLTPVRKYVEIPALGTLPIGKTCEGFAEMGFVGGQNFVVAERTQDVLDYMSKFDVDQAQKIANAAQDLVLRQHSETARIGQLAESFLRIAAGTFRGSYWERGTYLHHD